MLRDGDRVVLIGSTFVERDQSHGYLETALTARFHRQHIQFRNLGWSGDTVYGEARRGLASRPTALRIWSRTWRHCSRPSFC